MKGSRSSSTTREREMSENPTRDSSHMAVRDPERPIPLTERQLEVLRCVERFFDVHGFPPALRDLGLMLDMSSLHAITTHLEALVRKGYLSRERGERRAMRVLVASNGAVVIEAKPLRKARLCADCRKRRIA